MVMTDPIADMLTRLRNAQMASHKTVDIPSSNMKLAIAKILQSEGFISKYHVIEDQKQNILRINLKYDEEGKGIIFGLKRVSRPGLRVYAPMNRIPKVLNGLGISIVSTSRGVLSDKECRTQNVGGEILCNVW